MTVVPAALRAASIDRLTGAGMTTPRPEAVGRKFDPEGRVLPYPGNTFLCHVPLQSPAHAALTKASAAPQAGSLAAAFSFLPPSSFHMTVFEGVTDLERQDGRWPEGVAIEETLAKVTARFATAIDGLTLPVAQSLRPVAILGGGSVALTGAAPEAEAALRQSRDRLRAATGIRRANFDSYGFHITLAYALRWLTRAEAEAVQDLSDAVFARLVSAVPVIDLGPVEFCSFADMHAFQPLQLLDGAPAPMV